MGNKRKLNLLLLLVCSINVPIVNALEIDKTSNVMAIYDGDTFEITTGETIRLADIDCPENGEYGYYEATTYLSGLISGKKVYLDIDDRYHTDSYGRLVCVVYVEDGSRYLNVNKALLSSGNAEIWDHDNEFNPYSWNLYEETRDLNVLAELIVPIIFIVLILRRYNKI